MFELYLVLVKSFEKGLVVTSFILIYLYSVASWFRSLFVHFIEIITKKKLENSLSNLNSYKLTVLLQWEFPFLLIDNKTLMSEWERVLGRCHINFFPSRILENVIIHIDIPQITKFKWKYCMNLCKIRDIILSESMQN